MKRTAPRLDCHGFPFIVTIYDAQGVGTDEVCHSERKKRLRQNKNRAEVVAWLGLAPEESIGDYGRCGQLAHTLAARAQGLPDPEFRVWDGTGFHS